jgi:hypothetical protein
MSMESWAHPGETGRQLNDVAWTACSLNLLGATGGVTQFQRGAARDAPDGLIGSLLR